jgi:hypothetical protein
MITYSEEVFEEGVDEVIHFFEKHRDESSSFKELELDVDLNKVATMQNEGLILCFAMRDDGKVVGYCMDMLSKSFHYKDCLFAITDVYYILPEYRARYSAKFFKFIEDFERDMGIYARMMGYSMAHEGHERVGAFLKRLGYSDMDTVLLKRL